MRNFFQRIAAFMQGRYGFDKLGGFMLVLCMILWAVNIFVFNRWAHLIIFLIETAILLLAVFRALSLNFARRSAENRAFLKVYDPVKNWFKLTVRRIKDRKDFRYIKCPVCKAQLRVKNRKGVHTVRCPRCGSEFEKKI